jgi:catecholate siderophore receptor
MLTKKVRALSQILNANNYQLKLASFLMATTMLTSVTAKAQTYLTTVTPHAESSSSVQEMPTVTVESTRTAGEGYSTREPSLYKLTSPLIDTPKSVTSISRQLLDDQGNTTMRDALRNVPGVSIAAGEGGAQGDNLTIRGFTARSDFFLDGMRDFGSYYRDPFNMETIEVLKGPDSILFGRGSTGGVVNQVSKQPELYSFNHATVAVGSDLTRRATLDSNYKVDDKTAFRVNLMGQDGNVAGRNGAENSRYGFAPTIAMGLGTPTRLTLGYFHQSESDIPDYGLPWFYSEPAHVSRENFYGFKDNNADFLKTDADIVTAKAEHDFNSNYMLRNQFRFANYQRRARITEPQVPAGTLITAPLSSLNINRNEIAVDSVETFLSNQTDLTSKFKIGNFKHTLVSGLELSHETSDPTRYTWTGVPTTNLVDPNDSALFSGTQSVRSRVTATADGGALYAVDTMAINEKLSLIGGLRYDYVKSSYDQSVAPVQHFTREDLMLSYRAGIVYKPAENGSVYFSTGTSFNPSIEQLALSAATANAPPEETTSYEVGTKWDFFKKKLSATFALFRDEKTNARTPDPNNALLNVVSGNQRVDGFEVGMNGHLTDRWQVFTGYAYMTSKVVKSNNPAEQGNQVANAPHNTFNLFTTYDLPWHKVQIGGGMNAVSSRTASTTPNTNTQVMETAPGYVTFNAMAKYPITDKVALQLNVYNLLDKYYYDQLHPAHVVPGAGRTVLLTTTIDF